MADKTDEERVVIWSTGDKQRTWLILLASTFFYSSLILVLRHNWNKIVETDYNTIVEAISTMGSAGVLAITLAFLIIEGVNLMLISVEKYRKAQREEGRQERDKQWLEWLERVSAENPNLPLPPFIENGTDQNGNAANNT